MTLRLLLRESEKALLLFRYIILFGLSSSKQIAPFGTKEFNPALLQYVVEYILCITAFLATRDFFIYIEFALLALGALEKRLYTLSFRDR